MPVVLSPAVASLCRQVLVQLDRTIHLPGMPPIAVQALKEHRADVQAQLHNPARIT